MFSVYPRVKVREQDEEDDQFEFEKRCLQSLKLPSNDFSSPDDSPTSVVRVPLFMDSSDQGGVHSRELKVPEDNTTSIKASPVLRPRAVLSSRDNDQLLGSKSKTRKESFSSAKKDSSLPNRHMKCKVVPRTAAGAETPVNTRKELQKPKLVSSDPGMKAKFQRQILKPSPRKPFE